MAGSSEDAGGIVFESGPGRWLVALTVAGSGMALLDGTVVNVALPDIGRDFDASTSALQWILNGYLLTLASLILLGGSLGDRHGRRRIFIAGVLLFTAASLVRSYAIRRLFLHIEACRVREEELRRQSLERRFSVLGKPGVRRP